jgi:catechol 2,3-dioxygenase-like lactoylglutathione lyase family enzyme
LSEKIRRYRSVFARMPDLPVNVGFVVDSERRARTVHDLVSHHGGSDSRMNFLTAIGEQLRRDPLGATWTDGRLQRPARDLVPISTGVSWPIVTPGCLSDAEVIAALDDRGLSFLPELQRYADDHVASRRARKSRPEEGPRTQHASGCRDCGAGSVPGTPAATTAAPRRRRTTMIDRMHHVGIVVDDLAAATEFFVELGLELEVETPVEGRWVDRVVGLDDVRVDIAMVRTSDGHGRLELTKFHSPTAVSAESKAPANTLGIRRIMFAVDDIDAVVAGLRARGAELVGEVARYEDSYRLCYVRGPEGIIVALAEQLS